MANMYRLEHLMVAKPTPEILMYLENLMQDILEVKGDHSEFTKHFPDLLDAIFVGSFASAWIQETEPQLVRQLVKLLGPQGLFFQILLKYTSNSKIRFKFQYDNLPYFTQHLICKGGENLKKIAPLFKTKMDESFSVQLNMLEYFVFYFALSATIPHHTILLSKTNYHQSLFTPFFSKSNTPKEIEDCYISLLNEYVNSLWNTNFSIRPMVGSFSSYSDLFLNVFVQFWLCQSGIEIFPDFQVVHRAPTTHMVQSIKILILHFIRGNPDFDFSLDYQGFSRTHSSYGAAVDKMKRYLEALSLPLYGFLKINMSESLKTHPQNFTEIVDLWLMFLRPWHAVSSEKKIFRPKPTQTFRMSSFTQKLLEGLTPVKWRASLMRRDGPIVEEPLAPTTGTGTTVGVSNTEHSQTGRGRTVYTENVIRTQVHFNLAFYVHLLSFYLAHTAKSSQSDTERHTLYRVLKAYHKDLLEHVRAGEAIILSGSKDPTVAQVQKSYNELEKEQYIPIRCQRNCENTERLVQDLKYWAEREKIPIGNLGKKDRWRDINLLIQMICDIFGIPDSGKNIPIREFVELPTRVTNSTYLASEVEKVEEGRSSTSLLGPLGGPGSRKDSTVESKRNLDQTLKIRGPDGKLTSTGKEQILRGARLCSKMDVVYLGDERLRPITSMEIAFLVRLTYHLSIFIEKKTGRYYNLRYLASIDFYKSVLILLVVGILFTLILNYYLNVSGKANRAELLQQRAQQWK